MADTVIPVVDFEIMGLNAERTPPKDEESVRKLAEDIYTAFSTIGFVYLKNHGISDTEVNYWPVVFIPLVHTRMGGGVCTYLREFLKKSSQILVDISLQHKLTRDRNQIDF